jgi:hypothetical protein
MFNHLVRSSEERLRNRQPERLGRFEIDRELECCRGLNRQIGGVGAADYFIDVGGRAPETSRNYWLHRPSVRRIPPLVSPQKV